jgi:hypothetical protein
MLLIQTLILTCRKEDNYRHLYHLQQNHQDQNLLLLLLLLPVQENLLPLLVLLMV